jgi:hypothetical protein
VVAFSEWDRASDFPAAEAVLVLADFPAGLQVAEDFSVEGWVAA